MKNIENIGIYATRDVDINDVIRNTIKEVNESMSLICDDLITEAENTTKTLEEYSAFMKGAAFVFKCVAKRNDPTKYGTHIALDGNSFLKMKDRELSKFRNKNIGFVFQNHQLLPEFTALENVLLPARIGGISEKEVIEKAHSLFEDLNIASRLHHKPCHADMRSCTPKAEMSPEPATCWR